MLIKIDHGHVSDRDTHTKQITYNYPAVKQMMKNVTTVMAICKKHKNNSIQLNQRKAIKL